MYTAAQKDLAAMPSIVSPMVVDNVLALLGNTPIVRLGHLQESFSLQSEINVKLEYMNPGGSHKARIACNMIAAAERQGVLRRGSGQTIIEGTGGNTGLGLAIAANLLGYRLVLVVPDNYSSEKIKLLKAYGANVILSDSSTGRDSHFVLAQRLLEVNPDWFMPDQLSNVANIEAHYEGTAQEILAAFQNSPIDVFVAGAGSGGHITGIGRALKERWPGMKVCLVQPEGCDFMRGVFASHKIQATAIGRVPPNLDLSIVDMFVDVTDEEAVAGVQVLLEKEGIGVGLSSGANIAVCLKVARESSAPLRILCLAYDQVAQYLDAL